MFLRFEVCFAAIAHRLPCASKNVHWGCCRRLMPCRVGYCRVGYHAARDTMLRATPCRGGIPCRGGMPCRARCHAAQDTMPRKIPCRAGYHAMQCAAQAVVEPEVALPEKSICAQAEHDRPRGGSSMRRRLSVGFSGTGESWDRSSALPAMSDSMQQYNYSEDYEPKLDSIGIGKPAHSSTGSR